MKLRPPALVAGGLGLAIALAALGVYFFVDWRTPARPAPQHAMGPMVDRLAARLRQSPQDVQGWAMLGRSYQVMGRFAEASAAFGEAVQRAPGDAQLLADYADVLAIKQGRKLAGEPERLIARALQADPENLKALALAGTIAFDGKDYAGALLHWERMARNAAPGTEAARMARGNVDQARALLGSRRAPGIHGVVRIAPQLASRLAPGDTVFVYARAAEGPRMPLAVVRKQAGELPAAFVLDDSMAMAPERKLSSVSQVVVAARVSRSGQAAARTGDLEGQSRPVSPATQNVEVVIDREVR
jgi:cytochrome c-type biogenesis protein CcmH